MKKIMVVKPSKNTSLLTAQSNYMLIESYESSYAFYLESKKYHYLVTTPNMSHKDVDCYQEAHKWDSRALLYVLTER